MHKKRRASSDKRKRWLSDFQVKQQERLFQPTNLELAELTNLIPDVEAYNTYLLKSKSHNHEQIFAYVILHMCFQSSDKKSCERLIDLLHELIEKTQFQLILPTKHSQLTNHSQLNLKNILSQYMNLMNQRNMSVMESLNKYPIVMEIFTTFFRTLICLGDECDDFDEQLPMANIYDFLTAYFQIQAIFHENHVYFSEADIYAHEIDCSQGVIMLIRLQLPSNNHIEIYEKARYCSQSLEFKKNKEFDQKKSGLSMLESKMSIQKQNKYQFHLHDTNISRQAFAQIEHENISQDTSQRNISFKSQEIWQRQNVGFSKMKPPVHYRNWSEFCFDRSGNSSSFLGFSKQSVKRERPKNVNEKQNKMWNKNFRMSQNSPIIQDLFYNPLEELGLKKLKNWTKIKPACEININAQKDFTNSFILNTVQEPYRSKIKATKQRAKHHKQQNL